jgi:predicted GIY-YIG superfamily endonuclease
MRSDDDGRLGLRVLRSRAREAPAEPGVYFFLGPQRELLYVGKAADLRRRLLDHSRDTPGSARARRFVSEVREVQWARCADEREALCQEADFIIALAPTFNAVMTIDAYTFVRVDTAPVSQGRARLRFQLTEDLFTECRMYGAFPHLGKGKSSWRAVRSNAGYSAVLRLLWVALGDPESRFRLPAKLRGSSPPAVLALFCDAARLPMLHDFLSGRSSRLLAALREAVISGDVPDFMRRPLLADLERAKEFYELAPHALRRLRLRHGLPARVLDRETFTALLIDELTVLIGSFKLPEQVTNGRVVGRRTARSMQSRSAARRIVPSPP